MFYPPTSQMNNSGSYISKIQCLLAPTAKLPVRANPTDAGADLFSTTSLTIPPNHQALVSTGVSVKIPPGRAGLLMPRSSQRAKGISSLGSGLIDSDYRGELKMVLRNFGTEPYHIEAGTTKIGQLVIIPVDLSEFVDVWNDTDRGTGGFGSTGK